MVDGAEHMPMLMWHGVMWHLSLGDGCYLAAGPPPAEVTVLTPAPTVAVLRAGYRPAIDRSVGG